MLNSQSIYLHQQRQQFELNDLDWYLILTQNKLATAKALNKIGKITESVSLLIDMHFLLRQGNYHVFMNDFNSQ